MDPQRFLILLTHSSRPVDFAQCDEAVLRRRYASPDRLKSLPPFESLASIEKFRMYSGGVSALELSLSDRQVDLRLLRSFDPGIKLQHVAICGDRLIGCLEDALVCVDRLDSLADPTVLRPGSAARIDDPWFAGLHTAFAVGPNLVVVSASAADAVLWVDLERRCVTQRTRLFTARCGANYVLAPDMDLRSHFLHNDLQVAHLNCAWPHHDRVYVSSLIGGNIVRLDTDGSQTPLISGYVGCHGARITKGGEMLYFADSCHGRLVICDLNGAIRSTFTIDSKWLHDVHHVTDNIFLFCASDRNRLDLIDVSRKRTLVSRNFDDCGASLQFLSVQPLEASLPEFMNAN
jgi:hypothetical protein